MVTELDLVLPVDPGAWLQFFKTTDPETAKSALRLLHSILQQSRAIEKWNEGPLIIDVIALLYLGGLQLSCDDLPAGYVESVLEAAKSEDLKALAETPLPDCLQ